MKVVQPGCYTTWFVALLFCCAASSYNTVEFYESGKRQSPVMDMSLDQGLTLLFQVSATPDIVIMDGDRKVVYRGHEFPDAIEPYL